MKKLLLLVLTFMLTGALVAQSTNQPIKKTILTGRETNGIESVTPVAVPKATSGNFIGTTYYDNWSNNVVNSKIVAHDDGTVSAVWLTCGPTMTSRGTGYNYFNGTSFIDPGDSYARIETTRTGWGCIGALTNGNDIAEVVVAHDGSTGLTINVRPQKGTGAWTQTTLLGPNVSGSTALLWPQVATSGNVIHVIACTESDYGHRYNNIQTCLVYYRGTYNGTTNTITWESPRVVGDVTADYVAQFSGDAYSITSKGNKIAVLVCVPTTDVFYWLSEDNGVNWTRHTVFDSPIPDGYREETTTITDTPFVCDGTGAIAIGDDGTIHVAFAIFRMLDETPGDASYSYFGLLGDGVVYWNSTMGEIGHYGSVRKYDLNPDVLLAHNYKVMRSPDLDGDGIVSIQIPNDPEHVYAQASHYGLGVSTSPQLVESAGNVYLFYTSCTEYPFLDEDYNGYFYRGVFGTKLTNNGANWDGKISWLSYGMPFTYVLWENYNPELIAASRIASSEDVYPVVASKIVNGKINMLWQTDPASGCEIKENSSSVAGYPSNINFLSIEAATIGTFNNLDEIYQGLWQESGIVENSISKMNIYPNPAVNEVILEFLSKESINATVTITNVLGQEVYNKNLTLNNGLNKITTNVSHLSNGFYIVNVKSATGNVTQKLIKK